MQDQPHVEIPLHAKSRHWFIQVAFAGRQYVAELGYYQTDQRWKSLAVSETASTPPEGLAEDKTVHFATVSAQHLFPQGATPGTAAARTESPEKAQTLSQPERAAAHSVPESSSIPDVSIRVPGPEPPAEPAPQAWVERGFPAQKIIEERFEAGLAPVADWTSAQEQRLAEIIGWNLARLEPLSSAEMVEVLQAPVTPLEEMRLDIPTPIGISSLPPQEEISSPAGGEIPVQKGFWFSVNAELVIYGATDPSARVTIGGRPIQLRPDGTFSYRFALPDGRYELPILATSVQGDLRRADLEFYRGTSYQGEVQAQPQDPNLKKPEAGNVS
jgi:hypothetical protein